jgi:hypothetical protein
MYLDGDPYIGSPHGWRNLYVDILAAKHKHAGNTHAVRTCGQQYSDFHMDGNNELEGGNTHVVHVVYNTKFIHIDGNTKLEGGHIQVVVQLGGNIQVVHMMAILN